MWAVTFGHHAAAEQRGHAPAALEVVHTAAQRGQAQTAMTASAHELLQHIKGVIGISAKIEVSDPALVHQGVDRGKVGACMMPYDFCP